MTARTPSARSFRRSRRRAGGERALHETNWAGLRQAGPVGRLLDEVADPPGGLREPSESLPVGAAGGRDRDPLPAHETETDPDVCLGDVLVDLRVGEARQGGVLGVDEHLGLGGAGDLGEVENDLRDLEPLCRRPAGPHLDGAHFITPTWTLRNRAPEQACPTWPVCGGSPLPQFGVPSIT